MIAPPTFFALGTSDQSNLNQINNTINNANLLIIELFELKLVVPSKVMRRKSKTSCLKKIDPLHFIKGTNIL